MARKAKRAVRERFYDVDVTRVSSATENVRVKARNMKDAKAKALDAALDIVFGDDDADYKATGVAVSEDQGENAEEGDGEEEEEADE